MVPIVGIVGKYANRSKMTVSEVADYLRCSSRHVINLIEEGRLFAMNVGTELKSNWRVSIEELGRFERVNSTSEQK